jgi:hypothetical protein
LRRHAHSNASRVRTEPRTNSVYELVLMGCATRRWREARALAWRARMSRRHTTGSAGIGRAVQARAPEMFASPERGWRNGCRELSSRLDTTSIWSLAAMARKSNRAATASSNDAFRRAGSTAAGSVQHRTQRERAPSASSQESPTETPPRFAARIPWTRDGP